MTVTQEFKDMLDKAFDGLIAKEGSHPFVASAFKWVKDRLDSFLVVQ